MRERETEGLFPQLPGSGYFGRVTTFLLFQPGLGPALAELEE
ncbi:hypothetical protein GWI33_006585, partial [Rhynchophorus ferrugineus]